MIPSAAISTELMRLIFLEVRSFLLCVCPVTDRKPCCLLGQHSDFHSWLKLTHSSINPSSITLSHTSYFRRESEWNELMMLKMEKKIRGRGWFQDRVNLELIIIQMSDRTMTQPLWSHYIHAFHPPSTDRLKLFSATWQWPVVSRYAQSKRWGEITPPTACIMACF